MRRLAACVLFLLGTGCGSGELEGEAAPRCPAACSEFEVVGSLVELAPGKRWFSSFSRIERTSAGWAVAYASSDEPAHLQPIDANGAPKGAAFRFPNTGRLVPHWDGTALGLWAPTDGIGQAAGSRKQLLYARFDAEFVPVESASLSGPEPAGTSLAYDHAGAQVLVYTSGFRVGLALRQLSMLPGPVLEQREHILAQPADASARSTLAWTGSEIAVTYFTPFGYRTTFLDPTDMAEKKTVELGSLTGAAPRVIHSAMGESLLWIAVEEQASRRLWLRALDGATGTPVTERIELPWFGILTGLTLVGDAPLLISRPSPNIVGQLENDAVFPVDLEAETLCRGTRFGKANVIDLELDGNEGAALLNVYDEHLYFARVRCQ